ncbi:MAG: DUF721 domain-containing protein, partial [Verrucomicrobiae bacterium]|nr:DUF721 domain-containing protein [Verrucomicrobiae bacterium]
MAGAEWGRMAANFQPAQPDASAKRQRRARRRVLAAWRRVDLAEAEGARKVAGRALAEVLPKVLAGIRLDQRPSESQMVTVWRQVVDPQTAAHAQPVGLVRGTLIVAVDSSVWLAEIMRYRRREILERVQDAMGRDVVQRISFR